MLYRRQSGLLASGLALCASLALSPALAENAGATFAAPLLASDEAANYDLLPTAEDFRLDTHTAVEHSPFHLHHMQRSDPRLKAADNSERIYLGENLPFRANVNRSADVQKSGELYLELNQRGAELVFRF